MKKNPHNETQGNPGGWESRLPYQRSLWEDNLVCHQWPLPWGKKGAKFCVMCTRKDDSTKGIPHRLQYFSKNTTYPNLWILLLSKSSGSIKVFNPWSCLVDLWLAKHCLETIFWSQSSLWHKSLKNGKYDHSMQLVMWRTFCINTECKNDQCLP